MYGDKTTYPNIWHFSCDEGFTQHGSTERKCQPNGTWSGKSTFCQGSLHLCVKLNYAFFSFTYDRSEDGSIHDITVNNMLLSYHTRQRLPVVSFKVRSVSNYE